MSSTIPAIEKRINEWKIPFAMKGVITTITDEPCPGLEGTPAWYLFTKRQAYLNLGEIFGEQAAEDDFAERLLESSDNGRYWPTIHALTLHEHAHSAWSNWRMTMPSKLSKEENRALSVAVIFDELRIEQRVVNRLHDGNPLRPSFRWLLERILSKDIPTNPLGLSTMWVLLYGRSIPGIATPEEVANVDNIVRASLGDERVDMMREILDDAVAYAGTDDRVATHLLRLGQEWIDLFPEEPEDATIALIGMCHDPEHSSPSTEETESGSADGEGIDGPGGHGKSEANDQEAGDLLKDAIERMAKETIRPIRRDLKVTLTQPAAMRNVLRKQGRFSEKRPTPAQIAHASALSRTFERLSLPSIQRVSVPSTVPPGRLRSREMVRKGAESALGMMTSATPWERTRRTRTTTKPIVVGTMTDTSGSMGWAEGFVAEFAYVTSMAGVKVNARTAAVTFGDYVTAITKTGETPTMLRVVAANGGSEAFDQAAATLDLMLKLTAPTNYAKLLFIVSDGHLVNDLEPEKAVLWLKRMRAAGTTVVWIGCDSPEFYPADVHLDTRSRSFDTLYRDMEQEIVRVASRR